MSEDEEQSREQLSQLIKQRQRGMPRAQFRRGKQRRTMSGCKPDSPAGFLRFYGQSGVMGTGSGPLKPLRQGGPSASFAPRVFPGLII